MNIAIACALITLASIPASAQQNAADTGKDNPFQGDKIWQMTLEISPREYEAMQPPQGGLGFPGGPPQAATRDPMRDSERNLFGTQFYWAQADLSVDGQTHPKIGIRYAGDITYFASAQGLKRPLKIEFNKFVDQNFHEMAALQLHSMPMDPANAREALALSVFRASGVPAPRAAFAEVTLNVPGKHDNAYLGLYLVLENVDKRFLQSRFGSDAGLLMKPFQVRSVDHLGDDWEAYKPRYRPQGDATKDQSRRVIDFAHLVNNASDKEFKSQIGSFLDIDEFLRFLAANALTSNLESVFALGHNYFLYLDPKSNKFIFLPGDLEFSFANFLLMGTAEQLMDLSIRYPYPGENKLAERVLGIRAHRETYWKLIENFALVEFSKDRLLGEINAIEKITNEPLARESQAAKARREPPTTFGPPGAAPRQPPDLKTFAAKRSESITSQLKGKSTGFFPTNLNLGGPPAGGGGFGTSGQPTDE